MGMFSVDITLRVMKPLLAIGGPINLFGARQASREA
jgi:hypothetical protein